MKAITDLLRIFFNKTECGYLSTDVSVHAHTHFHTYVQ